MVSPQSVGRKKDRIRCPHGSVWDAEYYASCEEHKSKADEPEERNFQRVCTVGREPWRH